jgi:hypothetical protein
MMAMTPRCGRPPAFSYRYRSSRLFSTTTPPPTGTSIVDFEPPEPPGTHGTPVFPDIDLSIVSATTMTRHDDPDAVFVVTGASRGLGREFVRQLLARTKVRTSYHHPFMPVVVSRPSFLTNSIYDRAQ